MFMYVYSMMKKEYFYYKKKNKQIPKEYIGWLFEDEIGWYAELIELG